MFRLFYLIFIFFLSCAPSSPFSEASEQKLNSIRVAEITRHPPKHPEESDREKFSVKEEFPFQVPMNKFLIHPAHDSEINALIVLRGGISAVSGGRDGKLIFHRITSPFLENKQALETELVFENDKPILALALSPDERFIAIAESGRVRILDLRKRKLVAILSHLDSRVTALAWDPRNDFILIGLANGDINVWNFWGSPEKAKNNINSLEFYFGATTPVDKLLIHPKGRAFFSLEQSGILSFWRLQRTEIEQGMRDLDAVIDEERKTKRREVISHVPDQAYDLYLSKNGNLFLAAANGVIYKYKVRGLKSLDPYTVSRSEVFSISDFADSGVFALSTREQRIDFWCESYRKEAEPLFISKLFPYTISHLRAYPGSNYLWAATKKGSILTLESGDLLKDEKLKGRLGLCG